MTTVDEQRWICLLQLDERQEPWENSEGFESHNRIILSGYLLQKHIFRCLDQSSMHWLNFITLITLISGYWGCFFSIFNVLTLSAMDTWSFTEVQSGRRSLCAWPASHDESPAILCSPLLPLFIRSQTTFPLCIQKCFLFRPAVHPQPASTQLPSTVHPI